jgi:predicted hydrocarbon binding protein
MDNPAFANFFLPNRFVHITIKALEEVVGSGAMKAVCHHAGLPDLDAAPPPDDMNCDFSSEDFSKLFASLSDVMGMRGGRSLAIRAGKTTMKMSGLHFGTSPLPSTPLAPITDPDVLLVRLNRLSNFLNSISDMRTLVCKREGQAGFEFHIRQCPNCATQKSQEPVCAFFEGFIDQAVRDFSYSENFLVSETECLAAGGQSCMYSITTSTPAEQSA